MAIYKDVTPVIEFVLLYQNISNHNGMLNEYFIQIISSIVKNMFVCFMTEKCYYKTNNPLWWELF